MAARNLRTRIAELEAERDAAKEQLEWDRTQCADFLTKLTKCMDSRFWLTEGRGSYAWDDDRYREEFKDAAVELLAAIEPLRNMAANLTSGLQTTAEVVQARIDLKKLVLAITAERDAAKAEAEKLKAELAAEENNCPFPDFSCGTFAAERGIELRPAGGPTYTTTSDHWQGILRDLDAARAGEARAVEGARNARAWEARTARLYKRAIKALRYMQQYQTEKGTGTALSILVAMEDIDDVLNLAKKEIGRHVDESLAWLAQREREAAARELEGLMKNEWIESFQLKASIHARIAALTNQQPTACPRSEVRGEGES
jgi:hypothetical protein